VLTFAVALARCRRRRASADLSGVANHADRAVLRRRADRYARASCEHRRISLGHPITIENVTG
jgi:hypothetical protein